MLKQSFPRIFEPDERLVHLSPPLGMDQVTLCGKTDWIGVSRGTVTTKPVTCQPCRWIAEYCQDHRRLPKSRAISAADRSLEPSKSGGER